MNRAINKKIIALVAIVALVAILGVCLVACNKDDYTKRLEKEGYTVVDMTKTAGDSVEWAIMATKADGLLDGEMVSVAKYKKTDDAKKAEENAKKSGMTVKRSGKIVIGGSEQGVKDAQ